VGIYEQVNIIDALIGIGTPRAVTICY
jgi:hypothetical protein